MSKTYQHGAPRFSKLIQALFLVFIFFASCSQDEELGYSVLPDADKTVTLYDEEDIEFYIEADSIYRLDRNDITYSSGDTAFCFLGTTSTAIGKTHAGILTQFDVKSYPVLLPEGATIDSAFVTITVEDSIYTNGTTSRTDSAFTVSVYPVTQHLYVDSIYYSDELDVSTLYDANKLVGQGGYKDDVLSLNNEIGYDGNDSIIRIRLADDVVDELANKIQEREYSWTDRFFDNFLGFYIAPNKDNDNIMLRVPVGYVNVDVHYHYYDQTNDKDTSDVYSLVQSTDSESINIFEHDRTTAREEAMDAFGKDSVLSKNSFLESLAGIRNRIKIPNLDRWKDSTDFIIISAYIQLQGRLYEPDLYKETYPNLQVYALSDKNELMFLNDYLIAGSSDFLINAKENNLYTYETLSGDVADDDDKSFTLTVDVTNYVQDFLTTDETRNGLILKYGKTNAVANAIKLDSISDTKLKIIYTKFTNKD